MIPTVFMLWLLAGTPGKELVGPPAPPAEPVVTADAEDPQTLRLRVDQAMKAAEEQLRRQQAGATAQEQQKEALDGIDKLLKIASDPPPSNPDAGSPPPPAQKPPGNSADDSPQAQPNSGQGPGGNSRSNQKTGNAPPQPGGGSAGREKKSNERSPSAKSQPGGKARERRGGPPRPKNNGETGNDPGRANTPPRGNEPPPGPAGERPGDAPGTPGANPDQARGATMPRSPTDKPDKLSDMTRDVWGHLPEALRQEVDHYYRERFMPRYQDLIRQYYNRLAEAERKSGEKK